MLLVVERDKSGWVGAPHKQLVSARKLRRLEHGRPLLFSFCDPSSLDLEMNSPLTERPRAENLE